jgi:stage IV sporulation protein FB
MNKIKIHPSFVFLAAYFIVFGRLYAFANILAVVILHELAHAKAASLRGYSLRRITLMPYGAVIYGEEKLRPADAIFIALAGPAFNLFCAVTLLALWWLFPVLYVYTDILCYANISLALFNLLPLYPLDGSRIILSLAKNKRKTLKILKAAGVAAGVTFIVFFIISLFNSPNATYLMVAVFIIYSAFTGTQKEALIHISNKFFCKNIENGIEKRTVYISADTKLIRLMSHINGDSLTTFIITDKSLKVLKTIEESELEPLTLKYGLYARLRDIIT